MILYVDTFYFEKILKNKSSIPEGYIYIHPSIFIFYQSVPFKQLTCSSNMTLPIFFKDIDSQRLTEKNYKFSWDEEMMDKLNEVLLIFLVDSSGYF